MKQKSDAKKRQEGRCLGTGNLYVGFIKANEIGSIGTSTAIYDPIAERTVDTETMLKYLVAHKAVSIPMDGEIVRFASLVRGNEENIRETYRRYRDGK